ncbi:hypothetical protein CN403_29860 [Bacillus cereus]|nr:hypothetical protein CN403_29860 [Bacillus cereus]
MNYMDTYQYTVIHANELEILKCCIRFSFAHLIVRKNGISCKLVCCYNLALLLIHLLFDVYNSTCFLTLFLEFL